MTFTIEWGWWLAPLLVTLVSVAVILKPEPGGYIPDRYFTIPAGLIASLAAWLIWALLR